MLLMELFDPSPDGFYDAQSDQSPVKWKQSGKTILTLRQIRKLRKMNDVRSFEYHQNLKKIQDQYAPPQQAAPGI